MKFVDVRHSSHHCNSCGQAHRKYTNIIFRGWLLSIDKIRSLHPCHSFVSDEVFQIAMNLHFIHDIFHLGAMAIKRIWGCVAIFIVDVFHILQLKLGTHVKFFGLKSSGKWLSKICKELFVCPPNLKIHLAMRATRALLFLCCLP